MPGTEQITIQERTFNVPAPYAAGPVELTDGEAHALNQVFHENIRNNLAKKIKELSQEDAQAQVDLYAEDYEFGVRTGGGGTRDPVKQEAMRIARELVRRALMKAGKKLDDFSSKSISERAAVELGKHPEWTEQARATVAAQKQLAEASLDSIETA